MNTNYNKAEVISQDSYPNTFLKAKFSKSQGRNCTKKWHWYTSFELPTTENVKIGLKGTILNDSFWNKSEKEELSFLFAQITENPPRSSYVFKKWHVEIRIHDCELTDVLVIKYK